MVTHAMSRRDDGLSIAVWENSPWRSFVRCWDSADSSEGQADYIPQPQTYRPGPEAAQTSHQDTDDVREIFGRALDAARSKKSFVSAASVTQSRQDFLRSEARLMAEDNRSWGASGRLKWGHSRQESDSDVDASADDDDEAEDGEEDIVQTASPRRIAENKAESISRSNSLRMAQSPYGVSRRGTATGSGAADESEGSAPGEVSASGGGGGGGGGGIFRMPSRLQIMSPVGGHTAELMPTPTSAGALTRSPQGGASPMSEPVATTPGSVSSPRQALGSAARVRAARAAAGAGGAGGSAHASSPKLLHLQAANMPVRHSIELHPSRKPLSPGGPQLLERQSNTSDGDDAPGAGAGSYVSAASAAAMAAAGVQDRVLTGLLRPADRDRRTPTGSGYTAAATTHPAAAGSGAVPRRGSGGGGGGGSSGGSGVEQSTQLAQLHSYPQSQGQSQRDALLGNGRSRRTALLSGPDGGAGGAGGGKGPGGALVPSPSGRLPDPHATRLHSTHWPSKGATPTLGSVSMSAAMTQPPPPPSYSEPRLPRTPSSYSQVMVNSHQASDFRKHPPAVTALSGDGIRVSTPSSGSTSDGRSIMGRLRGLFAQ